jgi:hypothetical protein
MEEVKTTSSSIRREGRRTVSPVEKKTASQTRREGRMRRGSAAIVLLAEMKTRPLTVVMVDLQHAEFHVVLVVLLVRTYVDLFHVMIDCLGTLC